MTLWTNGNNLELFESGDSFFQAVLKNIREARSDIFFETYIYEWDKIGQELGEAFLQAAARGVRVHVLLDSFGSHNFPPEVMAEWNRLGIRTRFYQSLKKGLGIFRKGAFSHLHRKCIVIDNYVAFVGGINVADDYLQQPDRPARLDYAIQISGPLVSRIHRKMSRFFFQQFKEWKNFFSTLTPSFNEAQRSKGNSRAAFVTRSTFAHRRSIEKEYLKAIESAQKTIVIANAYFLPGFWFRYQLKQARKRGVRVQLLLQGLPEFWTLKWATQAMYQELLKYGVEIYEYEPSYLHAKVAVIDKQWSTVGSSNLDPLSLRFNLEANVLIQDPEFAAQLQDLLETHIQKESVQIELESYQNRGLLARFLQKSCLVFIRWLILLPH